MLTCTVGGRGPRSGSSGKQQDGQKQHDPQTGQYVTKAISRAESLPNSQDGR